MNYSIDDLVADIQNATAVDRDPDVAITFALSSTLRRTGDTLLFTPAQLLASLFTAAGGFEPGDAVLLRDNALTDEDVAGFLLLFAASHRRLPSLDFSANALGRRTADALLAAAAAERALDKPVVDLPPRYLLLFDTMLTSADLDRLATFAVDLPQLLPIPARVALLAAEGALDAANPTSSIVSEAHVGARIWAGFTAPYLAAHDGRRFVTIEWRVSRDSALDAMTSGFYVRAIAFLCASYRIDALAFSTPVALPTIAPLLATNNVRCLQLVNHNIDDGALATLLATTPLLQCIIVVDEIDRSTAIVPGPKLLRHVSRLPVTLFESTLYDGALLDNNALRLWLSDENAPIQLHRINPAVLPLPDLMRALTLCSNARRLSLAHVTLTAAQLGEALAELPTPTCLRTIDARHSPLLADDLWPLMSRFRHLTFEYFAQPRPLMRGMRLDRAVAGKPRAKVTPELTFRAIVRAHTTRPPTAPTTLIIGHDASDLTIANALSEYVAHHAQLPPHVDLSNRAVGRETLGVLAQYVHTIVALEQLGMPPVSVTAVDFSNTPLSPADLSSLPHHRALHVFPRAVPAWPLALTLREVILDEDNVLGFIEGGGTDAAAIRFLRCNEPRALWPGMFSHAPMYDVYCRLLATRATPPIRALIVRDRAGSDIRLPALLSCVARHLFELEYVLLESPIHWRVDLRLRRHASPEANDVATNAMIAAATRLLSDALPKLSVIDIIPYSRTLRHATVAFVEQLAKEMAPLRLACMPRSPHFIAYCGGAVMGRFRPDADNLLIAADDARLPFSAHEIAALVARPGHPMRALVLSGRADVTDNVLLAIYLKAVPPLDALDVSRTRVSMAAIKLLADHPEVPSCLRTIHFADLPHTTRMPQIPPHFSGLVDRPLTPLMIERMRLADTMHTIGSAPVLSIGAPKRMLADTLVHRSIETGDELLDLLQRIELAHVTLSEPMASLRLGDVVYEWSAIQPTLVLARTWASVRMRTLALFFRFGGLAALVHRLLIDGLAVTLETLSYFYTLPGAVELVIGRGATIDAAALEFIETASLSSSHAVVLYVEDDTVPTINGITVVRHTVLNHYHTFILRGPAERHLPYALSQLQREDDALVGVQLVGLSAAAFFSLLACETIVLSGIHFVALSELTVSDTEDLSAFSSARLLRAFPDLRNIAISPSRESESFSLHVARTLRAFRSGAGKFRWTDLHTPSVLFDAAALAGERPAETHALWLANGTLRPPFALDDAHYRPWRRILTILRDHFSNVTTLDLSALHIDFDVVGDEITAFSALRILLLRGATFADDIVHAAYRGLEAAMQHNATLTLDVDDAQRTHIEQHHPLLAAMLARSSPAAGPRIAVESAMAIESGVAPGALAAPDALAVWHLLRGDLPSAIDADAWPDESPSTAGPSAGGDWKWSDVHLARDVIQRSFALLARVVLDALAEQKLPYTVAHFDYPRYLTLRRPLSIAPLHSAAGADNVFQVIANASVETQCIVQDGLQLALGPSQFALVRTDGVSLSGAQPILLLAMQVTLLNGEQPLVVRRDNDNLLRRVSEREAADLLQVLRNSSVFGAPHAIQKQPALPAPLVLLPMDIPTPSVPEVVSITPAAPAIDYRADTREAERQLYAFLLTNNRGTPFVSKVDNTLWIGFFENNRVQVRVITLHKDAGMLRRVTRRVGDFKAKMRKRAEGSFVFVAHRAPDADALHFSVEDPALHDVATLTLARTEFDGISTVTKYSPWHVDSYPYAKLDLPALALPLPVPSSSSSEEEREKAEKEEETLVLPPPMVSFAPEASWLERQGFLYESYVGRGATAFVLRVRRASDNAPLIAKIMLKRDDFEHERDVYAALPPEMAPFVVAIAAAIPFPPGTAPHGLVGDAAAARMHADRLENDGPLAGGVLLLERMEGDLRGGVTPQISLVGARFVLRLKSDGALMEGLRAWMAAAEDAAMRSGFLHRDLFGRNVLFRVNSNGSVDYRLTDFGLSLINTQSLAQIASEWNRLRASTRDLETANVPLNRGGLTVVFYGVIVEAAPTGLWLTETAPAPGETRARAALLSPVADPSAIPTGWLRQVLPSLAVSYTSYDGTLRLRVGGEQVMLPNLMPVIYTVDLQTSSQVPLPQAAPVEEEESGESESEDIATEDLSDVLMPSEKEEEAAPNMDALSFLATGHLINDVVSRTPLVRLATIDGVPTVQLGFVDDANVFEYVSLSAPHLGDANAKTPANRQRSFRDYFAKHDERTLAFDDVGVTDDKLHIHLRDLRFAYNARDVKKFEAIDLAGGTADPVPRRLTLESYPFRRERLADAGYAFVRTLNIGQESIVLLVEKAGVRYAAKLFRDSPNFAAYRRPSFISPDVIVQNFYEAENDAYDAVARLPSFAPLRSLVLPYVAGAPLRPMRANAFVGSDTGERDVLILGYIILGLVDGDLDVGAKSIRSDLSILLSVATTHQAALRAFLDTAHAVMRDQLGLLHGDLHLYNVFYKVQETAMRFYLGDLATLRRAETDEYVARADDEWAVLDRERADAFAGVSPLAAPAVDQLAGRALYDAEAHTLHVTYEDAAFVHELHWTPLTLSLPVDATGFVTLSVELLGNPIRRLLHLRVGNDINLTLDEKTLAGAKMYEFRNPTEAAMAEARAREVVTNRPIAHYKPRHGKYDTGRFNRLLERFNELVADKRSRWSVQLDHDDGTLRVLVNDVLLVTIAGLSPANLRDLPPAAAILSVERLLTMHVGRSYRLKISMRILRGGRKFLVHRSIHVPDMAAFDVTLDEAALAAVSATRVPAAPPMALQPGVPMVFAHARSDAPGEFSRELRNAAGQFVVDVFGDVAFNVVSLLLASNTNPLPDNAPLDDANIILLRAATGDGVSYAFALYNFNRDLARQARMFGAERLTYAGHFVRSVRAWMAAGRDVAIDFDLQPIDRAYGGFYYYDEGAPQQNFAYVLRYGVDDANPPLFIAVPRPSMRNAELLSLIVATLQSHISVLGTADERTEEEPDDGDERDVQYGGSSEESSEASEEAFIDDAADTDMRVVHPPLLLSTMPASSQAERDVADYIRFALPFVYRNITLANRTMTLSHVVNGAVLFEMRIESETLPIARTLALTTPSLFYPDAVSALAAARYNDAAIRVRVVAVQLEWVLQITVEDSYKFVREFARRALDVLRPALAARRDVTMSSQSRPRGDTSTGELSSSGSENENENDNGDESSDGDSAAADVLLMLAMLPERHALAGQVAEIDLSLFNFQNPSHFFLTDASYEALMEAAMTDDKLTLRRFALELLQLQKQVASATEDARFAGEERAAFLESVDALFFTTLTPADMYAIEERHGIAHVPQPASLPTLLLRSTRPVAQLRKETAGQRDTIVVQLA